MNLLAGTLNENLGNIVTKLNELMDSFWLYIVLALAAVVVVWGRICRDPHCGRAQERRKDQCPRHGEKSYYRHHHNFRDCGRCAAAHQRTERLGRYGRGGRRASIVGAMLGA